MIGLKRRKKYKVRAWYYAPIIDNSGAVSKDYVKTPDLFYCAFVTKLRNGIELLTNVYAESNDATLETDSLIKFRQEGKICLDYINPTLENSLKIKKDGIQTIYDDKAMAYGNKFKSNRNIKKRIQIG